MNLKSLEAFVSLLLVSPPLVTYLDRLILLSRIPMLMYSHINGAQRFSECGGVLV